tara:strand:+ start:522 stop:734 length:213 start_codon:yes stop_codon:yes gene_type:complete
MSLEAIIKTGTVHSAWELSHNRRRAFTYTGENITEITLEELKGSDWVVIFKQTLVYDGSNNLLSITGIKL